jgi:NADPH:quinone reductase-like Zn-dependent oxidoreductase
MKAAVLVGFGGVDQLELREVAEPQTGPGQVKVRVVATSINPIDWKLREGMKRPGMALELPAILGRDASGEVVEVGSGVTRFRPGARVTGLVMGAYAERVVAKDEAWAEVPDGLSLPDAAALPLVTLTGSQLVEESLAPGPSATILVTGALGSVGRSAVFAARRRGVRVWAGVRRNQREAAEALGVDGVVALDDEIDSRPLPTLDGIADTVGASVTERLLDRVRQGRRRSVHRQRSEGANGEITTRRAAPSHLYSSPSDRFPRGSVQRTVPPAQSRPPLRRRPRPRETHCAGRRLPPGTGVRRRWPC